MKLFRILGISFIFICYAESDFLDKPFASQGILKKNLGEESILFKIIKQDAKCCILGRSLLGSFYLAGNLYDYNLSNFNHKKYALNAKNSLIITMLMQRDKKILAIGNFVYQGISHIILMRYLENEKLDKCFGDKGIVLIPIGKGASPIAAYLIPESPREKLTIIGNASFEGDSKSFLLSIDNLEELVAYEVKIFEDNAYISTASQDGDALVIAGTINQNEQTQVYIDRINISDKKSLHCDDKKFFLLPTDNNQYQVKNIAINSRTKEIILVMRVNNFYGLMKINNQGNYIKSFGENDNGMVVLPEGAQIESIKIDKDDNIILVGFYNQQIALFKYKSNGKLDSSFGNDGIINPVLGSMSIGADIYICEDGKLLVAGMVDSQMALMRFRDTMIDSLYVLKAEFDSINPSVYCIEGESSKLAGEIDIYIDQEHISNSPIDDNGNWSFSFNTDLLMNGLHSLKAILHDSNISIIHEFFVTNNEAIVIKNIVDLKQAMFVFGTSNVAHASVLISCNGIGIAEAKTDAEGKWSANINQQLLKKQLVSAHLTNCEGSIRASAVLAV